MNEHPYVKEPKEKTLEFAQKLEMLSKSENAGPIIFVACMPFAYGGGAFGAGMIYDDADAMILSSIASLTKRKELLDFSKPQYRYGIFPVTLKDFSHE